MKILLYIDTSDSKKINVNFEIEGKKIKKIIERDAKVQMVLPLIEKILAENKIKLADLTEIKVNTGPGSFTGLRVGIAVANTLGVLLNIPVNGQTAGQPVFPVYTGSKYDE